MRKAISFTISDVLYTEIEVKRGSQTRSRFIEELIIKGLTDLKNDKEPVVIATGEAEAVTG